MVPDDGIGASTAKAEVNTQMMVSVNMPAIVSPAFVEGASPIGLVPGENSPFTYVSWEALQSMVITSGATFAVQPVEIGANQVPIPIGDATLVTCGPFECAMGAEAPELSVANSGLPAWDPELGASGRLIDNDVVDRDDDAVTDTGTDREADDIERHVGRRYRSRLGDQFHRRHDREAHLLRRFQRRQLQRLGPDSAKGSEKLLPMDKVDRR